MKRSLILGGLFTMVLCFFMNCTDLNVEINLPPLIIEYIHSNYPGYNIGQWGLDKLCSGEQTIVVAVSNEAGNEIDLVFDTDSNLLFVKKAITVSELPLTVKESLNSHFLGYLKKKATLLDMPNGDKQYMVLIKKSAILLEIFYKSDGQIMCQQEESNLTILNLPLPISRYLNAHFSGYVLGEWEQETLCTGASVFMVAIVDAQNNDLELAFDINGQMLFSTSRLFISDLPSTVLNAINTQFSGYSVKTANLFKYPNGNKQYLVGLRNGGSRPEILFNADGSVVCKQEDLHVIPVLLPSILTFINNQFSEYSVAAAEEQTMCTGVTVLNVTIVDAQDNHLDLAFDVNGRWLFTNNRIKESDLPSTVKASIQANFAGYEIKKAFRLDMANGSKQYIAELRNGNIRPNVLFNANGSIICKNGRDENPD